MFTVSFLPLVVTSVPRFLLHAIIEIRLEERAHGSAPLHLRFSMFACLFMPYSLGYNPVPSFWTHSSSFHTSVLCDDFMISRWPWPLQVLHSSPSWEHLVLSETAGGWGRILCFPALARGLAISYRSTAFFNPRPVSKSPGHCFMGRLPLNAAPAPSGAWGCTHVH